MRPVRYWLRRAVVILATADNVPCHVHTCPEPTVGFSRFCREHTDQVLEGRHDTALRALLAREVPSRAPDVAPAVRGHGTT